MSMFTTWTDIADKTQALVTPEGMFVRTTTPQGTAMVWVPWRDIINGPSLDMKAWLARQAERHGN